MKKFVLPAAVAAVGVSAVFAGSAFAAQGSGKSAAHRNDNFVVICHYDRNQQGPNAGPHTITIDVNALDHHLQNHVKAAGFVGDDSVGACPTPTVPPTATTVPTLTPIATVTPPPTDTATPQPTATATAQPLATETATPEPIATDTPTPEPTATDTPTPEPTATDTPTPEPTATDTPTPQPTLPPD